MTFPEDLFIVFFESWPSGLRQAFFLFCKEIHDTCGSVDPKGRPSEKGVKQSSRFCFFEQWGYPLHLVKIYVYQIIVSENRQNSF